MGLSAGSNLSLNLGLRVGLSRALAASQHQRKRELPRLRVVQALAVSSGGEWGSGVAVASAASTSAATAMSAVAFFWTAAAVFCSESCRACAGCRPSVRISSA